MDKEFDLNIDGQKLRVYFENKYENAPVMVFLHDSFGCIELWKDFPYKLAERTGTNILIYDRLGYGRSDANEKKHRENNYLEEEADVLNKILVKLNIETAILFGHSDGGSIALITASKYPLSIRGIITEGAHIFVEEITKYGIKLAIESYNKGDLRVKLSKYHGDKTDKAFRDWADTWLSEKYSSWNIENMLPAIKCPVLIIQGENDEYGSSDQVNKIEAQVSGKAVKLVVPDARHTPIRKFPHSFWTKQ